MSRAAECEPAPVGLAVLAAASGSVLIWAGTVIVTKFAVGEVDAIVVGLMRTVPAALLTAPLALAFGLRLPRDAAGLGLLSMSSIGGFVAFPILFSIGINYTTASHAALIMAALPIYTGLFAAIADRRAPAIRWWAGVAVAFIGEFILIFFRLGFEGSGESALLGDFFILLGCACSSLGYVGGARLARAGTSNMATAFWPGLCCCRCWLGARLGSTVFPFLPRRGARRPTLRWVHQSWPTFCGTSRLPVAASLGSPWLNSCNL